MSARTGRAPAKLNLSLRVRSPDASGMHPLVSLAQTVGWSDLLTMEESDQDELVIHGAELPEGGDNLVWKAVEALREASGARMPVSIELIKRIPAAAGLGGGSSDAAAALRLYDEVAEATGDLDALAATIGADVTYCLHGGLRWMTGYGERLSEPLDSADDYRVVVVVPPFELPTPQVYGAWDRLGEPDGPPVSGSDLPPSLRVHEPLVNDLYPAARSLQPDLDDWRAELSASWDRQVLMSGSGPSLFSFFADEEESAEALSLVPAAARGAFSAAPIASGATLDAQ